jgi:hypothetical protein
MKTKKKWIFAAAFLLLPILFAVIMQREVAGAVTIFTIRGTTLRVYQSDSGNLEPVMHFQARAELWKI